jgi:hypothetical protein
MGSNEYYNYIMEILKKMGEDSISKPTTPLIHLNDEINEDTGVKFEPIENDIYIVHLNDVH